MSKFRLSKMFTPERRTRLQVLVEILENCGERMMKTDIMYKTRTIHSIFSEVLREAHRFGLVNRTQHKYHTTPKGKRFLEKWWELQAFLKRSSRNKDA